MDESFLQYVWKYKLFDPIGLKTTGGEELEILAIGEHNTHAGPDFLNARVRIGTTLWAGNVEIHLNASEWSKHRHNEDDNYTNVILHVVLHNDVDIHNKEGAAIPALEIRQRILPHVFHNYQRLKGNTKDIACNTLIGTVPDFTRSLWLDRLAVERLEQKTTAIQAQLEASRNDWEELFYRYLAANFGFKVNTLAFKELAGNLPRRLLSKYSNNALSTEALLFGQAGLLEKGFNDKYLCELQNEYSFLQQKHGLQPMKPGLWKFMRMRPLNFPTIRISQFSALIQKHSGLFSKILECTTLTEAHQLLNVSVSDYWKTHYMPDKPSARREKRTGQAALDNIVINTIAPFLFLYGGQLKEQEYINRALRFLSDTPAEQNTIIRKFEALGIKAKNAHESQALLQLYSYYCSKKQCCSCAVGNVILRSVNDG